MVSPELRAAEREIDNVPLRNALVEQPFSQAAWRFMAANEERVMREIVKADQTGTSKHAQYYAALFDSIVASTKWPMRWLLGKCRAGNEVPQEFDDDGYVAANELSDLGQDYSHFEAAFTYASLGVLTLVLEDRSIRASHEFRRDTRYDAYDRLRQPRMTAREDCGEPSELTELAAPVRTSPRSAVRPRSSDSQQSDGNTVTGTSSAEER